MPTTTDEGLDSRSWYYESDDFILFSLDVKR